jgi:hypothetical protein
MEGDIVAKANLEDLRSLDCGVSGSAKVFLDRHDPRQSPSDASSSELDSGHRRVLRICVLFLAPCGCLVL